jgi:hypothetical protein
MARTVATLPAGARITDDISLGVITKTFPLSMGSRFWRRAAKPVCASAICRHMW